jgi:hypothetical protein
VGEAAPARFVTVLAFAPFVGASAGDFAGDIAGEFATDVLSSKADVVSSRMINLSALNPPVFFTVNVMPARVSLPNDVAAPAICTLSGVPEFIATMPSVVRSTCPANATLEVSIGTTAEKLPTVASDAPRFATSQTVAWLPAAGVPDGNASASVYDEFGFDGGVGGDGWVGGVGCVGWVGCVD